MATTSLRIVTAGATDVGRRRSGNEDAFQIWVAETATHGATPDTLLVLCDGMGGSNAGEVASRMTVDAVVKGYSENGSGEPAVALAAAVEAANTEVHEHSRSRVDLQGMGTTCTIVALVGGEAYLAHVGDSRAYLVRGGRARQLTTDHSLVAQLVQRGMLTPEEAKRDPRRNVVTRSVGVGPAVEIDAWHLEEELRPGDTFLVCSDGLHGQVGDDDIARIASGESLESACEELISLANEHGGPDNITVAMARLEGPEDDYAPVPSRRAPARAAAPKPNAAKRRALQLLIAALIALVIALGGLAWMVYTMMKAGQGTATSARDGRQREERLAWR